MAGATVLVAEDDPGVRLTLEFVLADEGFEVLFASDGEQAVEVATRTLPDIILLDQVMPKMDGKQVLDALRAHAPTRSIPVVVLTGMDRGPAQEWPDAHFLGKPFSPEDLITCIRRLLSS